VDDIYYHIGLSGKVREELRRLRIRASAAGRGAEVAAALRVIEDWLRADPATFGEPIRDYPNLRLTEYHGSHGPIAITYTIHWDRRFVFIAQPFQVLRWAGF
jgi:hypothetical protein